MGFIVWLIIGGIIGWLASIIMKTDEQQGIFLNVVVGIAGAFIAGLVGARSINAGVTIGSVVASIIGAVALLALINLVRRGRVR